MTQELHLQNFINETDDMLRGLHEKLAGLVLGADNTDIIHEVFRVVHTIKGNASFFALANLKLIAHSLEDLLTEIRSNAVRMEKPVLDLLWNGINLIALNVEHVKSGRVPANLTSAEEMFISDIKTMIAERVTVPKVVSTNYRMLDTVGYMCAQTDVTRSVYVVKAFLEKAREKALDGEINEKFVGVLRDLMEVFLKNSREGSAGAAKKMISDFETLVGDDGQAGDFLLESLEEGFAKLQVSIREVEIRDVTSNWREIRPPAEKIHPSFRIEREKIDEIAETVRKLDTVKKNFSDIREKLAGEGVKGEVILDFQKAINSLNFFSRDLLQMIIKIKVTSPRLLLEKMEQIVASLALSSSKKIKINTTGKDIFVDRGKIEILEKILPHIVRNCIDHGIELPDERISLGKSEEGLISIEASKREDALVITVTDDGRGIDVAALRKGKEAEPDKKHVFTPGVSSRKFATDLSGRGVGMDVVLRTLEKVGGELEVFSELGKGSRFVITLPEETFIKP